MSNPFQDLVAKVTGKAAGVEARAKGLKGVFRKLAEQHHEVGSLLASAQKADDPAGLWQRIRTELVSHEQAELVEIYPVLVANERTIDRVLPERIGAYPINYGIVPQTVSYDGDPFDVLVLGPPLPGGSSMAGVAVGLMRMEDEKGLDSKVVISPTDQSGRPAYALTDEIRTRVADYFNRYKRDDDDPKTFATVPGWGTAADGLAFVRTTHAFFTQCQKETAACQPK